ncbi:MAG: hypothetical protein ABIO55_08630 [Ginsengibacter sp.]
MNRPIKWILINVDNNAKHLMINDYKYRALKTMKDESLKKALNNIDSNQS